MRAISQLPHLASLELSGHSYRYYDPRLLGKMPALQDLRIMMPDALCKDTLLPVIRELDKRPGGGLRGLGIIHRVSLHRADRTFQTVIEWETSGRCQLHGVEHMP